MGGCFSKKKHSSSSSSSAAAATVSSSTQLPVDSIKSQKRDKALSEQETTKREEKQEEEEQGLVKKEIFVIKHRKSHDKRSLPQQNEAVINVVDTKEEIGNNSNIVRTSSCTKEEVDAILIQCGRLSRSNSSGKTASSARKYSGSKRSYDFDHNDIDRDAVVDTDYSVAKKKGSDDDNQTPERRQHRQRHRSSSQGRRRTPSRERDQQQQQQQRSGSRERGSSSGSGRRVSRSPGRRSENNTASTSTNAANANNTSSSNRPGKMVSVPATVTSLVMDKSKNNGVVEPATTTTAVKRISVKRNAGEAVGVGSRTAASPRSKSPARTNANVKSSNENQQQPSLSRSSSRKAEHSPYRRNPLSEIDPNSLAYPQSTGNIKAATTNNNRSQNRSREMEGEAVLVKDSSTNFQYQKPNVDVVAQGTNYRASSRGTLNNKAVNVNCIEKEHEQVLEEAKAPITLTNNVTLTTVAVSGAESQKPQTITRSRSSRRSRDLDLNPEILLNPPPSYTALLLEDIQNFHQKNNTPSFSLPPCVTKACSILEAVADLNSTTSSNLSCAFSEDRKSPPGDQVHNKNTYSVSAGINLVGKKMTEAKDPFVESEVLASDDLMEPSFHKYVTVRRGGTLGGVDLDGQESSGSNSYVSGSQQNWSVSSSSWEPNSADSTDRWTSRSNTRQEDKSSSVGLQRHAVSETGRDAIKTRKGSSGKKRETDFRHGRVGASKDPLTIPIVAAAAST